MPVIKSGRCDECRRRKRKCDEARPSCSNCIARDACCNYSCEVSRFVHLHQVEQANSSDSEAFLSSRSNTPACETVLSIRSAKEPPSGNGLYHTLKVYRKRMIENKKSKPGHGNPVVPESRSLSISPPPCSDICRLQNEFGSVLHSAGTPGLHMNLLGSWLGMALRRIGTSIALDSSIVCLVTGHKAKYSGDGKAMQLGRRRYVESLTFLKTALAHGAQSVTAELIAATKVLMIYELLAGSEVMAWISHSYGVINLFLAAGPRFCSGDFEQKLYYGTYAQAWQQGMMIGKPSVFDTPSWLDVEPFTGDLSSKALPGEARKRQAYIFTRLARLMSLVRSAREQLTDRKTTQQAVDLAEELLELSWNERESSQLTPKTVPTARSQDADLVPFSLQYQESEFTEVILCLCTWCCKIMLSGLCQSLHACGAPLKWPTLAEHFEEERRCAMLVCMHADYAASLAPYGCAPMILSMQIAWGVYWRQKDLQCDVEGYRMCDWLLRRGNEFMHYWNAFDMHTEGQIFFTERLMGGPVLPPEPSLHDSVTSKVTARFRDGDLEMNAALPRSQQHGAPSRVSEVNNEHSFAKGVPDMLKGAQPEAEMKSLFEASIHNTQRELRQVWRES